MLKNYQDGTLDAVVLNNCLGIYAQTEKRQRIYLQALVMGRKLGLADLDASLIEEMVGGDENRIDTTPRIEDRTANRGKK
jgi:hypothetical protein